ncbi:MAG: hypothetical protein A3F67_09110 [Verrucomicrobia bacterium RIFCSPHIGHO2_12_FULL_41_10]|nr:MAG: hypothetical protein A3F67_09110 [Verrucomicrobia bacterium RIFCSPHIGHO2_12_FULL_41_10]HLB33047.1 hypothetical protein [Chthoniobacterales bacterium]
MKNLAIILIVVGIITLIIPYVSFTKKDKILDIGPIQAVKTEQHTIPIPPAVGIIIMAAGVIVLIGATRRQ